MKQYFLFISIILIGCSLKGQPILVGNWKPVKAIFKNGWSKSMKVIYDKSNNELLKQNLIQEQLKEYHKTPNPEINIKPAEFKKELENIFKHYDSSKLTFKSDSTFYLESFGLIIPEAVPGWSFSNKLIGKWVQNKNNTFKLLIGDEKISYCFYYKIIKLEKDSLIIGETIEDYSQTFNRIEFKRY